MKVSIVAGRDGAVYHESVFRSNEDINMGAWGVGNFENDTARHFVGQLSSVGEQSHIIDILRLVANQQLDHYMDEGKCSRALVAAEVVAAALGKPSNDFPESLKTWLQAKSIIFSNIYGNLAQQAVRRILLNSECHELWTESDYGEEWHCWQYQLLRRLRHD